MGVHDVLGSDAQVQVLRTLAHASQALSAEDLEREVTKGISMVYSALRALKEEHVLTTVKPEGKKTFYRLDTEHVLGQAVQDLFDAEREQYGVENVPAKPLNTVFAFLHALKQEAELVKVMLFGSTVRGAYTPQSDIDLYVVTRDKEAVEELLPKIGEEFDASFSFIVRTPGMYQEDFEKPLNPLAKSLLVDGCALLYGDPGEDEQLQERFTKRVTLAETASVEDESTVTEV